jgi:hypothetical protein
MKDGTFFRPFLSTNPALTVPETNIKGIVSPDWKGLQMVSLDRFEV